MWLSRISKELLLTIVRCATIILQFLIADEKRKRKSPRDD